MRFQVESPELKDIIGQCIRLNRAERPTIKELLHMDFFQDDLGIKASRRNDHRYSRHFCYHYGRNFCVSSSISLQKY